MIRARHRTGDSSRVERARLSEGRVITMVEDEHRWETKNERNGDRYAFGSPSRRTLLKGLGATGATLALGSLAGIGAATHAVPFTVTQGSRCVTIKALGDGTKPVSDFYDYRSQYTPVKGIYSSYGTRSLQLVDTSQLFVYRGSDGLSLVLLHDKLKAGTGTGGGVITADVSGLPIDGTWIVEDDTYPGNDDVFAHDGTTSHVEWVWNDGNRTDGAVFRGLESSGYDGITIEMGFNEDSNRYPYRKWKTPPEENRITRWIARSRGGVTYDLDMDQPVTVSPGSC